MIMSCILSSAAEAHHTDRLRDVVWSHCIDPSLEIFYKI